MCFTYEVLETFCNLPILAVNPKNCLHRTPHFPMTSQRAHPTAPNPRHPMAQRRVRSKHHTCTTPPTAPRSRLFTPLHPCRSMMPGTHRPITPRPRLFTPLHLCRSMAPCAYRPTAPYLRHTMLPSPTPLTVPHWAPRPPRHCSRAAGSLETKKLQKRQDFCFRKANYRNRSRFRNEPIAKGKSRDELIAATRRTPHE